MSKDIVFISHATHEDNYPAGWLTSKLQQLGYKIFIDLEDVRAGAGFYTVIQPIIKTKTCKFITVNTQSYVDKAANPNSGVRKEINVAATLSDPHFIIPVRFDDVDFGSFPMDYLGRNAIDFYSAWGEGLKKLVKELEKLNVPRSPDPVNPIELWHKAIQVCNDYITADETIYSNWFAVHLPEWIYVYRPHEIDKAQLYKIPSSFITEANHIICFASDESVSQHVELKSFKKFPTKDFIENEEIKFDDEFIIIKPYDKLKNLLNKSFRSQCRFKRLQTYRQAGEKEIFYFPFVNGKPVSVSLKKYGKTWTQLTGNKNGRNWHFGIHAKIELHPVPHYRVFYHILFSDDQFALLDKEAQQELRRSFSGILNNKKTFELLIAAMISLSPTRESDQVLIQVDEDRFLTIDNTPIHFTAHTSYIEPNAII